MSFVWSDVGALPEPPGRAASLGVIGTTLYALGGFLSGTGYLNKVQAYDGASWTTVTPMATGRGFAGVGVVGETLYAIGGRGSTGWLNSVEAFKDGAWTSATPLPEPRALHGVGVIRDTLYVIGGRTPAATDSVLAFDGVRWTPSSPIPGGPRSNIAVAAVGPMLYVCGGYVGRAYSTSVLTFNGAEWDTVSSSMTLPRINAAGAALGSTVMALGGNLLDPRGWTDSVDAYDSANAASPWKLCPPDATGPCGPDEIAPIPAPDGQHQYPAAAVIAIAVSSTFAAPPIPSTLAAATLATPATATLAAINAAFRLDAVARRRRHLAQRCQLGQR